jgi:uncharacterized membrane protein (UPF0127 family)
VAWLVRDGEVLASLEVATSLRARTRGLLGRDGIEGALLLRPAKAVHTVGMRFPLDVAYCDEGDEGMVVLRCVRMERHRLGRPVLRASCAIEAPAGAFARWRLQPGDVLDVQG